MSLAHLLYCFCPINPTKAAGAPSDKNDRLNSKYYLRLTKSTIFLVQNFCCLTLCNLRSDFSKRLTREGMKNSFMKSLVLISPEKWPRNNLESKQ